MAPSFFESPETAITAVISAVVCVLVATYPHAAIFYVRRVLAELWLIFAQLRYIGLTDQGSLLSWPFVQRELRLLLDIEKNRRLHPHRVARMARVASQKPSLLSRMLGLKPSGGMSMGMAAPAGAMVFKDLVLIGGGHSHAHVLKMFGMHPEPGVQLTLITRDVDTPYSGMLPGYVAGAYTWRECHIDLACLAAFANARLVHAEACGIDTAAKKVMLKGRPPISYDVLSIDIGSAPKPVEVRTLPSSAPPRADDAVPKAPSSSSPPPSSGNGNAPATAASAASAATATPAPQVSSTAITPVKPIDGFCKRWDAILDRVLKLPIGATAKILVVGGGAGGVELALSMQARLSRELLRLGRTWDDALQVTLVSRAKELMPQHSPGVRAIFHRLCAERKLTVLTGCAVEYATSAALHCTDGRVLQYDEAIWCTQGGAQGWLRETGLELDGGGFIAVHPSLESVNTPGVFASGDVAAVLEHPRPKAGVFAVRQGPPLTDNLRRTLRGEPTKPFTPQSTFLGLIGAGDGQCVASRGRMALEGEWLWTLKDFIDRTWMHGYQGGLREMMAKMEQKEKEAAARRTPKVASAAGGEALEKLSHASMRCGGCGAKVGVSVLSSVMARLKAGGHLPPDPPEVLLGLDAPDDCAVLAPSKLASVHTVDFFRSIIDDPFVFGQVAANHALSDCHAMNAQPTGALAIAVVPYGLDAKVEECLFQMMAGAAKALSECGCALLGGHSCEGQDLSLGFCVTGSVPAETELRKSGLEKGQVLLLTKAIGTGTLFAARMRGAAQGSWMAAATQSMLQSNAKAASILAHHGAHACTDVTGFGLLGHLYELCSASQAKARIHMGRVPLLPGAAECVASGIFSSLQPANLRLKRGVSNEASALAHPAYPLLFDPQTSGGLLAAVPSSEAGACVEALRAAGYGATAIIGEVSDVLEEGVCVPGLVECVE